jgi:DNA polymerase-3 subunit epsilon
MEILVIDIETTGFSTIVDAIVEIGIVLVNTDTKEITPLFNEIVKDQNFSPEKHKNSWIFSNSDLTIEDVANANPISLYFEEIQSIFNKYPVTAFNKFFDMRFMHSRKFVCKDIKCLMLASMDYVILKDKRGAKKKPSVQEVYDCFFPEEKYIEKHRGIDDAKHEAKILLKMCELKSKNING